jgi:serine protease Do
VWPLVAAVAIAGGSYFGASELTRSAPAQAAAPAQTARPTPEPRTDVVAPASDLARAFRSVHSALKDAVVNINVTKKPAAQMIGPRGRARTPIPEQFRNMLPPGFDFDSPDAAPESPGGTGSGVIVSADGYILTNNHVVGEADDITVVLNDGRELKANLVGTDPKTDLAVVRVKADNLTFAKFGDSDALDVGDWVLAFGSPFGFSQTMTQGIISAKGRHVPIIANHNPALQGLTYENFLQTDAAINPGNSGGPLVNLKGEVVGINAAIASNTGAYNGIGFSIPSNDARYIMDSLIKNGKVVRGYLGIFIEDVDHPQSDSKAMVERARKEGFKGKGVLVPKLSASGPGASAGLQGGDIITALNGKSFASVDELRNQIARIAPNTKATLTVFRDGKTMDLTATVGTQPDTNQVAGLGLRGTDAADAMDASDLGISVQDVTGEVARRYGLKESKGVVVTRVSPRGLAADSVRPGDVILRVDRTDVTSAKQFTDALNAAKLDDGVKLIVRSDDGMDRLVYIEKK